MAVRSKSPQGRDVPEVGLPDYLGIIYRGRWILLSIFVVVFGSAVLYVQTAPRSYQSTASVRIDTKQMRSSVLGGESASYMPNLTVTQNELEVLKSNAVLELAAKKLIEKRYPDGVRGPMLGIVRESDESKDTTQIASVASVAARVRTVVDFEPIRESDVIKITAVSRNPEEAATIANAYSQAYAERNVYNSRSKNRLFREFLEGQVKDRQKALAKSEDELRSYMEQKGVVSLDDESRKVIEQLSQLEAQRDAVEISIQSLEKTLQSYSAQVAQQEQSVAKVMGDANDPYIRQLQEQVAQLEVKRDFTVAQNPSYVGKEVYSSTLSDIDLQIQALKAKLKKRTDDFLVNLLPGNESGGGANEPAGYLRSIKQRVLQSEIELQSLQARKQALNQAIQDYNRQFERLPRKNMDYARLQRDKLGSEKLFVLIEEKYNEANITEQAQLGYVKVFDPAVAPGKPSSPKVPQTLLLGAFAGLGLGLLGAFARDRMNVRVRTPEDIKKRGFDLVTVVRDMKDDLAGLGGNGRFKSGSKSIDVHLVMATVPMAPVAESYRQVRTSLIHSSGGTAPKTILVTSPEPGEGKTTTICNLAIAFAQSGRKVLLVDADLRRPTIHPAFDLAGSPGLSELLSGTATYERVLQHSIVANLNVISSGRIPQNPAEYLGSETMNRFIDDMKKEYDTIFFDSPPVLAVTDASVLSSYAEKVLLVISAGTTTIHVLERAAESLESVGAKVTGVILNNFNLKKAYGHLYHKSSYGYYGYSYGPGKGGGVQAKETLRAAKR